MKQSVGIFALLLGLSPALAGAAEPLPVNLPMHEGLPLLDITTEPGLTPMTLEQMEISRWLALQRVAANPELLEDSRAALAMAVSFVPPDQWHLYMDGCRNTANSCTPELVSTWEPPFSSNGRGPSVWLGGNDEERERSRAAFVSDYGAALLAQATELPQDLWILADAQLQAASGEALQLRSPFLAAMPDPGEPQYRIPLWQGYSAAVSEGLPDALPCAPRSCAQILEEHPDHATISTQRPRLQVYPVYLLAKVRVSRIASNSPLVIGSRGASGGVAASEAELLGEIELFYDREMGRKLADLSP